MVVSPYIMHDDLLENVERKGNMLKRLAIPWQCYFVQTVLNSFFFYIFLFLFLIVLWKYEIWKHDNIEEKKTETCSKIVFQMSISVCVWQKKLIWLLTFLFDCRTLSLFQTTVFELFQIQRVCRRQFKIGWHRLKGLQMGRKHCGKRRRNCSLQAISPFPAVFSKGLFLSGVKRCHCVGMG